MVAELVSLCITSVLDDELIKVERKTSCPEIAREIEELQHVALNHACHSHAAATFAHVL